MLFQTSTLAALAGLGSLAAAAPSTSGLRTRGTGGGKLTVYWGAEDDNLPLMDVCNDPSYDIVNLAFVAYFNKAGGYPGMSMSQLNDGPSAAQKKAGATGLLDGSAIVPAIKKCQANGKPVIISLGGATGSSNVRLSSDAEGEKIADQIWNLFLGGTDHKELRPFGDVKLDGVDLDNETNDSTGYLAMTKRFRANMAKDTSKKYLMTAAPQCPFPDQSEPLSVCKLLDYVWVQFYNNGDCDIGRSGFKASVKNWSKGIGNAKLFIGGLASGSDGDEGYISADDFKKNLRDVQAMNLPNYGGAMLWEAELSKNNGNFHKQIRGTV